MIKVPRVFISEIEVSRVFLKNLFKRFHQRITPRRTEVNEMNYFPVRDCDTGDNLVLTLKNILTGIEGTNHEPKHKLIKGLEEEILLDAGRGNAGMVFTGWCAGFLRCIKEELSLTSTSLAKGMDMGRILGNRVFANPRRGTILDPISVAAQAALKLSEVKTDLVTLIREIIVKSREAVEHTTDRLGELLRDKNTPEEIEELKTSRVVDAGALGFLIFLESLERTMTEMLETRVGVVVVISNGRRLTQEKVLLGFKSLGESLDVRVAPSGKRAAVHIHTDQPKRVVETARGLGTITQLRLEDISEGS